MDEFDLIQRYFDRRPAAMDVRTGIGDDGAVLQPTPGLQLVSVVDTLVAGVHFPSALPAADTGFRAVAVNLSDIAAMAATPRWMTLALTLERADARWLREFSDGLFEAAAAHGLSLVGGDTTSGPNLVISIQIIGEVDAAAVLLRSGAEAGDAILVTGTLGDAAAGLSILQDPADDTNDFLLARFRRPTSRVDFARSIAPLAHAAIDVSDGLFADLGKMLRASGLAGVIEWQEVPLSTALQQRYPGDQALRLALGGGDDYELCFTAATAAVPRILEIAAERALRVSRIGTVEAGGGLRCTRDGKPVGYTDAGYRHFAPQEGA